MGSYEIDDAELPEEAGHQASGDQGRRGRGGCRGVRFRGRRLRLQTASRPPARARRPAAPPPPARPTWAATCASPPARARPRRTWTRTPRRTPCSPWTCASTCTTRCSSSSNEGVLGMALAESIEPNADGTQYTVKLKSGMTFHDGSPVNADAVVYSFERIMDPKSPGLAAAQLKGLTPGGTKKVDDLTVQFNLDGDQRDLQGGARHLQRRRRPGRLRPQGRRGRHRHRPLQARPGERLPARRAVRLREERELLAPGRRPLRGPALHHRVRRHHRADERPARRRRGLRQHDPRRAAQDRRGRRRQAPRGQDRLVDPLHHERRRQAVRRRARAPGVPPHRRPPAR